MAIKILLLLPTRIVKSWIRFRIRPSQIYIIGDKHFAGTATSSISKKPENIIICYSDLGHNLFGKFIPQMSTIETCAKSLKQSGLTSKEHAANVLKTEFARAYTPRMFHNIIVIIQFIVKQHTYRYFTFSWYSNTLFPKWTSGHFRLKRSGLNTIQTDFSGL